MELENNITNTMGAMNNVSTTSEAAIKASKTFQEATMKDVQPKFDTILDIAFQYIEGGRWHTVDMTMKEYLHTLQTGYVDDRQIVAIEVSTTNVGNEHGDTVRVIYDFKNLHTEKNPWRMI